MAGGGALLLWLILEPLMARRTFPLVPIGLTIVAASSSMVLFYSFYWPSMSIAMGATAAAMLIITILKWRLPGMDVRGASLVVIILLPAAMLLGWLYQTSDPGVPWFVPTGMVASPAAMAAVKFSMFRNRQRMGAIVGIVGVIVLNAICIILAQ